jgi:hypothetical protein
VHPTPRKTTSSTPDNTEVGCTISKAIDAGPSAQPQFGEATPELCIVLKLPGDERDISARIGSTPNASTPPQREDAVLLLRTTTKADIDDVVEVAGLRLKVTAISQSYDSVGKLAYHVVQAVNCETSLEGTGGQ